MRDEGSTLFHRLESFAGYDERGEANAEFVAHFHGFALGNKLVVDVHLQHLFARFVELNDRAGTQLDNSPDRLFFGGQRHDYRHLDSQ